MIKKTFLVLAVLLCALNVRAEAAGRLIVEQAWIRAAPPGAMMLAGYAVLRNGGDASISVSGAQSAAFGDVSIHETVMKEGVARMRALDRIELAPGASAALAPGGKHLMLMRPRHAIVEGDRIGIELLLGDGVRVPAAFAVRASAPD